MMTSAGDIMSTEENGSAKHMKSQTLSSILEVASRKGLCFHTK